MSVDPVMDVNRTTMTPQQWNRYAYGRNNPLRNVDPDGRDDIDFRIAPQVLRAKVNIIYSNVDHVRMNQKGETLRDVTEQGLAYSRNFFNNAGIALDVHRFEASIEMSTFGNMQGPVRTSNGDVAFQTFMNSQPAGTLNVVVSSDLLWTGRTTSPGGPTYIGVGSDSKTLNDELAHALGNRTLINDPMQFGNLIADLRLNIQELRVERGNGMDGWWQIMFRETLEKLNAAR